MANAARVTAARRARTEFERMSLSLQTSSESEINPFLTFVKGQALFGAGT
ncbi:hypothetical protein MPLB_690040 [Mesorhizobium sp. ORS 3324]|nr:hypothetical protein MPLB_690040 [Mesorhizobium sp. ORS 3324]